MKVLKNLDQVVTKFDGEEIKDQKGKPVTVRSVITDHLGTASIRELGSGEKLIKAYDLGQKIHQAKESVELDDEQIDFIKNVLGKVAIFTSVVMGYVLKYLDSAEEQTPVGAAQEAKKQ